MSYWSYPGSKAKKDLIATKKKAAIENVEDVAVVVAHHFRLRLKDIRSKSRKRDIVFPRQICMYICRIDGAMMLSKLAAYFGKADHTTVIHSINNINNLLETDQLDAKRHIEEIRKELFS